MLGNRFYNQSLRKLIIAFGQVFNNIVIQRTNKKWHHKTCSNTNPVNRCEVVLEYFKGG